MPSSAPVAYDSKIEGNVIFTRIDAAIPVVRVYDRTGKLRRQFDNDDDEFGEHGFSYKQHIVPLVDQLLRE